MMRSKERELFLKYLAKIYLQNPNLPILEDTVYSELSHFYIEDGKQSKTSSESLISIQVKLDNKFLGKCFSNGYFWVIENRKDANDREFYSNMKNAVKLYVAVDSEDLYQISEKLFTYMLDENIMTQGKVAKKMRNDALFLRVQKDDVKKIIAFLDKLDYRPKVRPNPFLIASSSKKVSLARDGNLSFNKVVSKLISNYMLSKRNNGTLDKVSEKDFTYFCLKELTKLKENKNTHYLEIYEISSFESYENFIMICDLIIRNLNNKLSEDELINLESSKSIKDSEIKTNSKEDKEKVLYLINRLSNYYSLDNVHKILINYIDKGEINYFTRREGIRKFVSDNFSQASLKSILYIINWEALVSSSYATYQKYGYDQLVYALSKFLNEGQLNSFTNQNHERSYLGIVFVPEILNKVLEDKLPKDTTTKREITLSDTIIRQVEKSQNRENNGKK